MRRTLLRSAGLGMALLALGLLANGVVELSSGPGLVHKPYFPAKVPAANKPQVVENYGRLPNRKNVGPYSSLDRRRSSASFGRLPLYFIENRGQLDPRVAYYIRGADKTIYFTAGGVTYVLEDLHSPQLKPARVTTARFHFGPHAELGAARRSQFSTSGRWAVKLDFVGANPHTQLSGREPTEAVISHFRGSRNRSRTGLRTFAVVLYEDLWPGIDLLYSGTTNRLKYTFQVKPGADPSRIKLAYRGSEVTLNEAGQLEVSTPVGSFRDDQPHAYQELDGQRVEIASAFRRETQSTSGAHGSSRAHSYGFRLGPYDPRQTLFIDPAVIVHAGFIGGLGNDVGNDVAVDSSGSAYIVGHTSSSETSFPVAAGPDLSFNGQGSCLLGPCRDAFVAKLSPDGTALAYAGYIGGTGDDTGAGIAVDSNGSAYVTGSTTSSETTFPVAVGPDLTHNSAGVSYDAFVAKINPTGTALLYAGYIGGSESDNGTGIAVDSSGNAYVAGLANSPESSFPVTVGPDVTHNSFTPANQSTDAFVAKVNPSGSALVYAGYIGGVSGDIGRSIAVDGEGNAYVIGQTSSDETSFPVAVGPDLTFNIGEECGGPPPEVPCIDVFVAKVNAAGTGFVYVGYIGGTSDDLAADIAVDGAGNAYITGQTSSDETSFPVAVGPRLTFNAGQKCTGAFPEEPCTDAFVVKVNTAGTGFVYAGYIGGSDRELGVFAPFGRGGIAVDVAGNAYVTGMTFSTEESFPVVGGPNLTFNEATCGGFPFAGPCPDAFIAKVNAAGTALEYAGFLGGSGDDRGNGIAVDNAGNAYVTGFTDLADFPTGNSFRPTHAGGQDVFIAKITDMPLGPPTLPEDSVVNGASFRPATDPNGAIAPGAIVAIFGTDLASDTVLAQEVPLLTTLGDTSVTFNDIAAPLFFVSGGQINAQVPFELMTGAGSVTVQVTRGSETTEAQPTGIGAVSPGIFTLNAQGTGQGAILIANTPFLAAPAGVLENSRPVQRGEFISIFCTGLGPVLPEVESGDVAPSIPPLAETLTPLVNIGGIPALVTFSGLAPGFVGLYQVNVQVPPGVPSGTQDVGIIINSVPSNTVTIAVE